MNHFMLPEGGCRRQRPLRQLRDGTADQRDDQARRHALTMEAKVFGGGAVISGMNSINVGERNTQFVLNYLQTERIPVVSKDVLDIYPRKVCFLPASGKAMVKRLAPTNTEALVAQDRAAPRRPRQLSSAAARSTCSESNDMELEEATRRHAWWWWTTRRWCAACWPRSSTASPTWNASARPADPLVAREMIRNLNPDVITLDVEMPRMDGIDFLGKLMRLRPMPVVMVSTLTERGADVTLRALELGAVDFVAKPKIGVADGLRQLAEDITDKIRTAARAHVHRLPPATVVPSTGCRRRQRCAGRRAPCRPGGQPGPAVDREDHLHRRLHRRHRGHQGSADEPAARCAGGGHHPAHAAGLHQELRHPAGQPVPHPREGGGDGERILPGHAYIAPGGMHLSVERSGANYVARVRDGEPVNRHKPSVEVLFESPPRGGAERPGRDAHRHGRRRRPAMKTMRDAGSWNLARTRPAAWSSACRARPSPRVRQMRCCRCNALRRR
jgi:two-component system chemotaxis response regulator CheB